MMINNDEQLQFIIGMAMAEALDNTTQILLDELKRIIDQDVYSYEESWGGRTGQWGESWEKSIFSLANNIVQSKIHQNYGVMIIDKETSSHIQKEELSEIIDTGEGYMFGSTPARPFWSTFENYVDANLDRIWVTECKKLGLDIKPLSRV